MKHYYEFGPFRLALDEHRLYRNGKAVLLPPKEFDLLLLLVCNSGQVMGREVLLKALWPNTIVEEANLNVHISALRKVLAESTWGQNYIETLPRLGYRFVVPVTQVEEPTEPAAIIRAAPLPERMKGVVSPSTLKAIDPTPNKPSRSEGWDWYSRHRLAAVTLPLWLLAIGLLGTLAVLVFRPFWPIASESAAGGPMNVVPLTTYPGREMQPAFSADGNQIAFAWGGEKGGNVDIYVRLVDGGN